MIGEVIESRTSEFVAESVEFDQVPAFGSFVKVRDGNRTIYGIVSGAYTGSLDGSGRAKAFFKSMEELQMEQPQIFSLLRTEFSCVIIGYREGDRYCPYYPPAHPRLHLPVEAADEEEILGITRSMGYLNRTLGSPAGDGEELTAAALRNVAYLQDNPREYVLKAGRELLKMLGYDTQRLKNIIERVDVV